MAEKVIVTFTRSARVVMAGRGISEAQLAGRALCMLVEQGDWKPGEKAVATMMEREGQEFNPEAKFFWIINAGDDGVVVDTGSMQEVRPQPVFPADHPFHGKKVMMPKGDTE